jgi:hypothetical protein
MHKLQHKPQPSLVLGSTVEGNKRVTLTGFDFERHKHIIGVSGSGKSSFLASCALLLLRQGVPFCLIDPHGDLAKLILSLLAGSDFFRNPRAYERFWYVDFGRSDAAIAFNVLKQPYEPHTVANNLLEATHRAFPVSGTTASLDNVILAATLVLVENGKPFTELHRFILDHGYRNALLARVSDPLVLQFFKSKFSEKVNSQLVDSTLRRSFLLTFSPALRNALGQRENTLNFRALMDSQTSCIFNLGGLDDSTKRFVGCLLMVGLEQAFLSRANMEAYKRTPYHVIVDEFPLFCASEDSFSVVLEQVRKYKGTLYLAHQTTSQLSKGMTGSLQNAISILFQLGYEDSTWAAQRFVRKGEEQEVSFLDSLLGAPLQQPGAFHQVNNLQDAKQVFETLERQEALVTMNKQVVHIRTHTVPYVNVDPRKLAKIEATYAYRLLTPLSTIEREQTASNMILVSSASRVARRVASAMQVDREPLRLLTGVLDNDILTALYYFHYLKHSQVVTLLQRKNIENHVRTKLNNLVDDGLIETTTLVRSTAGAPPKVFYLSAKGIKRVADTAGVPAYLPAGDKKHGYLEHSIECSDVLISSVLLPQVEPSFTLIDVKHERTLKNNPCKISDGVFHVPDGWVHLRHSTEDIGICFEIDRNTEYQKDKIVSKINNYLAFASGIYQRTFGLSSLTIAFCVTEGGHKRVKQLLTWAEQALENNRDAAALFLFGSVAPQAIEPDSLFLDATFHTPFENTPHALVETP